MDRTRRLRQTAVMRSMVRENHVRTEELIYPLFVMEGENIVQPVESMPGICQYSVDRMNEELDRVKALQIPAILIFGIPEHKDEVGSGAYDEHGIVQTAIRRIKKDYPELKASEQFTRLQRSIEDMELQLQAIRRTYNAAVTDYNNSIEMFPSSIVAGRQNHYQEELIDIPEQEQRNVDVSALLK